MTTPNTTIGLRLLSERKRLGLKQSDITLATGISKIQFYRYENNQAVPSSKSVQKLSKLGFNMDYVLDTSFQNMPNLEQSDFETISLRLKQELSLLSDGDIANALGLTKSAFSERKRRNAFPTQALLDLQKRHTIDTHYVLTGNRTIQIPSTIGQTIDTNALTPTQKIRLDLLIQTEVGQKILADFLWLTQNPNLSPLDGSALFFVQLEKIVQWIEGSLCHLHGLTPDTANTDQTNICGLCERNAHPHLQQPT